VNRIDVVLAAVLALFALRGFFRGFARELFAILGLVFGVAFGITKYADAAEMLPPAVPGDVRPFVAFVILFFAVVLAARLLGALVHRLLGIVWLSPLDRLAGAAFGALKAAVLVGLLVMAMRTYAPSAAIDRALDESVVMRSILQVIGEGRDAAATAGIVPVPRRSPSAAGG
jgi:membrane protein required for colicin V production